MGMDIGSKIRAARKRARLSQEQLTDLCGWEHQSRVSGYETGKREPSFEDLGTIAKVVGLNSAEELIAGIGDVSVGEPKGEYISIPFKTIELRASLDTADGFEIHFDEGLDDAEPLYYRRDWIQKRGFKVENLVARKVSGSSMEPALYDGDKVLINMGSRTPKNGVVFWVVVDGHPCIKRLRKRTSEWWITSDNPAHAKTDQPLENLHQIIGEAVEKSSTNI